MTTANEVAPLASVRTTSRTRPQWLRWLRNQPVVLISAGVLLLMFVLALVGPWIWTESATHVQLSNSLMSPSAAHPMGTDDLGRDVLARFLGGARLSLMIGLLVTIAGAVIGGLVGLVAGMSGRGTDNLLSWLVNTMLAFPPLMLAMAVAVALGASITSGGIGLGIAAVPWFARVLRSEVIRIRFQASVEAAIVTGASRLRIALRHVVPHLLPTLLIQAAASFGWSILTLAALGFVGLGAQPPTPEWGSMITGGLQYALTGQWWIGVFPGLGLVLVVTAATVLADRARDILDPRGSYNRI